MDSIVEFLTSGTGIFAALVALVGLVGAVLKIVLPMLESRRKRTEARGDLRMSAVSVENPPPYSEAGSATFQVMNSSGGKAVLADLHLLVIDHGPMLEPKMVEQAAPIPEHTSMVRLDPAIAEYDVRKRAFGAAPPHSYEPEEIESFRIELRSTEPQWYTFRFRLRWYAVAAPDDVRELVSPDLRIEFRPDVRDLVGG